MIPLLLIHSQSSKVFETGLMVREVRQKKEQSDCFTEINTACLECKTKPLKQVCRNPTPVGSRK